MLRSVLTRAYKVQPLAASFFKRGYKVGPNSAKPGMIIDLNGSPQIVLSKDHGGTGRGQAVIKLTFKHAITGAKSTERFRGSDSLEVMKLIQMEYQYLYSDGENAYLMNMDNYEELALSLDMFEGEKEKMAFLEDGMNVTVQVLDPEPGPISWRLPLRHKYKVKSVEQRIARDKGATYVPATLENGAQVTVPNFIKPGETIIVDLEEEIYISRA